MPRHARPRITRFFGRDAQHGIRGTIRICFIACRLSQRLAAVKTEILRGTDSGEARQLHGLPAKTYRMGDYYNKPFWIT